MSLVKNLNCKFTFVQLVKLLILLPFFREDKTTCYKSKSMNLRSAAEEVHSLARLEQIKRGCSVDGACDGQLIGVQPWLH